MATVLTALLTLAAGFGVGNMVGKLGTQALLTSASETDAPAEQSANAPADQEAGSPEKPEPEALATANTDDSAAPITISADTTYTTWDVNESPNYYRIAGSAVVGESPAAGTVAYGELDGLGRATGAVATVTYESMQAGLDRARGDLSELAPSGWGHNGEVDIPLPDGGVYHGFLYNRSHLVAKSLGGDDGLHNLITGTRMQNVGGNTAGNMGGMAYAEDLARSWLFAHPDGTVYYAATPAYEGNELVARSVMVDIVSSDGSVDVRIEVYNTARGYVIDYATGEFEADGSAEISKGQTTVSAQGQSTSGEVAPTGTSEAEDGQRKVIVTRSGKAYHHDETCKGLAQARSMEWVTVEEAEQMGRHPCGICGG